MFEHESSLLQRINPELLEAGAGNTLRAEFIPDHFSIQWHITDRCNLNCTHCYLDPEKAQDLPLEKLRTILDSYIDALSRMELKGRIQITGGEPFMRTDLFEITDLINRHKDKCDYGIMCNGTMVDRSAAAALKRSECRFVQVSIDGGETLHDTIRGEGSFRKAIEGIKILKKQGLAVSVSFTAGRKNYAEFPAAAHDAVKAGADSIWSDRVIPSGRAALLSDELMNSTEVVDYFRIMNGCRKKYEKKMFRKTVVSMGRALQFMYYDGTGFEEYPYRCTAGKTILTILADGRVVPCRRMPVVVGNLNNDDLYTIYHNSTLLRLLRSNRIIPDGCGDCSFSQVCNGGLKCLSYAVHGNPFIRDPNCTDFLLENRDNSL